jgi:hypothetical protein
MLLDSGTVSGSSAGAVRDKTVKTVAKAVDLEIRILKILTTAGTAPTVAV